MAYLYSLSINRGGLSRKSLLTTKVMTNYMAAHVFLAQRFKSCALCCFQWMVGRSSGMISYCIMLLSVDGWKKQWYDIILLNLLNNTLLELYGSTRFPRSVVQELCIMLLSVDGWKKQWYDIILHYAAFSG